MNVAVVTAAMRSGERGGAEALYAGLVGAVRAAGHNVTALEIPIDESELRIRPGVVRAVLRRGCQRLRRRHLHQGADLHGPAPAPRQLPAPYASRVLRSVRRGIRRGERDAETATPPDPPARQGGVGTFARPRALRQRAHDLRAPVRRRPVVAAGSLYRPAPSACARRIPAASTRRIRVSSRTPAPMEARGARGPGVQAAEARHPAIDRRHRRGRTAGPPGGRWRPTDSFLGAVTDEQLLDLYAGALVVPFVPVQEDYGLITIEAFKSQKPVITCRDSGEPLQFVRDGVTGCVVEPEEGALADRLAYLVDHPDAAAEMGTRAVRSVAHIALGADRLGAPRRRDRKRAQPVASSRPRSVRGAFPASEPALADEGRRARHAAHRARLRRRPAAAARPVSRPRRAGRRLPTLGPTTGLARATAITS